MPPACGDRNAVAYYKQLVCILESGLAHCSLFAKDYIEM